MISLKLITLVIIEFDRIRTCKTGEPISLGASDS